MCLGEIWNFFLSFPEKSLDLLFTLWPLHTIPLCEDFRAAGSQKALINGYQLSMKRMLVCFGENHLFTLQWLLENCPPWIGKQKARFLCPCLQTAPPRVCWGQWLFSKLAKSFVACGRQCLFQFSLMMYISQETTLWCKKLVSILRINCSPVYSPEVASHLQYGYFTIALSSYR